MIYQLSDSNFEEEVLKSDKPVLVHFYTDGYFPCKIMMQTLSAISHDNIDKIKVGQININENTVMALKYRALTVPMIAFFKNGTLLGKIDGEVPKSTISQKMQKYFEK